MKMINNITIVIVTYNSAKWIANCLQSVFRTEYKNFNVIVVDNASGDESATIITKEFPQAKLIQLKDNVGFSGGNNIGIQQALEDGSDAVVLLNPDTQVKENWLDELVKALHKFGKVNKLF